MSWFFKRSPSIQQVDPSEAWRRKQAQEAIVVDVRESGEWKSGHIPGARHIPLAQLKAQLPTLLSEKEVIFVCRSGARSASATAALAGAGHGRALNMSGGMVAWTRAGLPTKL